MRLLYLVDHWPGLFEAYLFREIQWMKDRGHYVSIVSLDSAGPHGFRNETRDFVDLTDFDLEDIPVLHLATRHRTARMAVEEALAFARDHEAQLIDAHPAREPAEVACEMHFASGLPFAVRMREADVHSNPSARLAEIVEHAAAICPRSRFLADVLTGRRKTAANIPGIPATPEPGKLHVVPACLPARYLAEEPVRQNGQSQVIGAIGRAVPVKRFPDIIEAVAALAPDFPGVRLHIVGGGALLSELKGLAARAGIANRFEVTGFRSWAAVLDLARQFHVYAHASELGGFGLSTIEAAFQGVPLVLSRTGNHEQCVEPGLNGYLFAPGDVPALRESLRSVLLAGPRKREQMGQASLEIAGGRFTSEKIMPEIEMIFQSAIENSGKPGRPGLSPSMGSAGENFDQQAE